MRFRRPSGTRVDLPSQPGAEAPGYYQTPLRGFFVSPLKPRENLQLGNFKNEIADKNALREAKSPLRP
jgi:hypothetical protein